MYFRPAPEALFSKYARRRTILAPCWNFTNHELPVFSQYRRLLRKEELLLQTHEPEDQIWLTSEALLSVAKLRFSVDMFSSTSEMSFAWDLCISLICFNVWDINSYFSLRSKYLWVHSADDSWHFSWTILFWSRASFKVSRFCLDIVLYKKSKNHVNSLDQCPTPFLESKFNEIRLFSVPPPPKFLEVNFLENNILA